MNAKALNKASLASFDVDAQNTFTPVCPAELPVPGGNEIAGELNAQAALASLRVGSKDAHSPAAIWVATETAPQFSPVAGQNVDIRWNIHGVPGTLGFELIEGLPRPADYDYFVWKGVEPDMHPYGACYHDLAGRRSTGVIEFLRSRGIETVLVGGLATDYCVKTTALQLRAAGFDVVGNLGACRGIAGDTEAKAIAEMAAAGIRFVDRAADIVVEV
ncbi:MAG: amidase [Betaproteobacteria bacterium]|nr:MAG: amidase [Betaproteobacteria bacterium]